METEINLLETIKLFLKNWWKIAISAILGAVLAFFLSTQYMTPLYTARGSLYVKGSDALSQSVTINDLLSRQQLAFMYAELLSSDTFMEEVRESSGLRQYTAPQIKSMIRMAPLNETEILEIVAVSVRPEYAQILVNTVLENAQDEIMRVTEVGNVSIVDEAKLPEAPSSPNVSRNTVLGFMLCAILCMAVIFMVDFFDTRIKTEEDIIRVKKLPLLGVIPELGIKSQPAKSAKKGKTSFKQGGKTA